MARAFTGRNKIMKFEGAWHGMHDYGLWGTVPSAPSPYPRALPDSIGVPAETGDTVLVAPFNETERAVALIEAHAHELAAVIVEPLQRVLLPEPGFLQALRDVTTRHGIVLVFDEIVTGFRIAWGGAQEKYGVVPDLACYGKAVSGGFPLAAIAGRADVMGVLDARSRPREKVVWATHTLNGNPVCATAGCAALDVLRKPGVYDRLHAYRRAPSRRHRRGGHAARLCGAGAGRGRRVRHSLHRPSPLRTWMDLTTADKRLGYRWAIELLKRGLLVNPNEKFYISIAHTDDDVTRTLEIVDEAFAAHEALDRRGVRRPTLERRLADDRPPCTDPSHAPAGASARWRIRARRRGAQAYAPDAGAFARTVSRADGVPASRSRNCSRK